MALASSDITSDRKEGVAGLAPRGGGEKDEAERLLIALTALDKRSKGADLDLPQDVA